MMVRSTLIAVAAGTMLLAASPHPPASPAPQPTDPAILNVSVSPVPVRVGSPVTTTVLTTPDVVSVQGHVAAFTFNIPKTSQGDFSGTTTVPRWAAIFHGSYKVEFVAKTADGAQTQAEQSIKI